MRLAWESVEDILINAEQACLGGASWLTIHARTKIQGYAPPVHWKYIGEVRKRLNIPVVANGDIWTREDFLRCRDETGCQHFMIGRGALADPALPQEIARELGILGTTAFEPDTYPFSQSPKHWEPILLRFSEICVPMAQNGQSQVWIALVDEIKRTNSLEGLFSVLRQSMAD